MEWFVYILKCGDGTLYTGITNHPEQRLRQHNQGKGAKYTRGRAPFKMIYQEVCRDRSHASRREAEIKNLDRQGKLALIKARGSKP